MNRLIFTPQAARQAGITRSRLFWGVKQGTIQRVTRGAYLLGDEPITDFEFAIGQVVATNGVAIGTLAGSLYGLDSVRLKPPFSARYTTRDSRNHIRRLQDAMDDIRLIDGVPCTSPARTLIELAVRHDDEIWEQMLESALRLGLTDCSELLRLAKKSSKHGNKRVRRVLAERPFNLPPTESLLETLAVQLLRRDPRIPTPVRQHEVVTPSGHLIARVDLAFPDRGVFLELDGSWHSGQPTYDANRQTRIIAATGCLAGRFTWDDITKRPQHTLRQVRALLTAAASRRT